MAVLCRKLDLFTQALVAIDGSKFKAVNNRDKNFTAAKLKRRLAQIDESIAGYLAALDSADRAEPEVAPLKKGHLQGKIAALKEQMRALKAIETQMQTDGQAQVSLTDPDARSMKNRDGGIVGYNVQAAVDAEHHLIVAHEVVTDGVDRDQLTPMAEQAREATGIDALTWRTRRPLQTSCVTHERLGTRGARHADWTVFSYPVSFSVRSEEGRSLSSQAHLGSDGRESKRDAR